MALTYCSLAVIAALVALPFELIDAPRAFHAQAEALLEHLSHLRELEITHFTMDFGHPLTPEHVLRFAEQVIDVMRAS
ncbi:MAG: hypothetical protein EBY44_06660 [Actinobacteria bacterium]|nr:hypothetical protein [Actinomycetota bacterium]